MSRKNNICFVEKIYMFCVFSGSKLSDPKKAKFGLTHPHAHLSTPALLRFYLVFFLVFFMVVFMWPRTDCSTWIKVDRDLMQIFFQKPTYLPTYLYPLPLTFWMFVFFCVFFCIFFRVFSC